MKRIQFISFQNIFNKKIDNDSLTWSFQEYKKGIKSSSTWVVKEKIQF